MPGPRTMNMLVYFECVARHGRLGTAADELHLTSSAVSQQIKSLEQVLGVKLFRRINRRLVLTEAGERMFISANRALAQLRRTEHEVSRKPNKSPIGGAGCAKFWMEVVDAKVAGIYPCQSGN